MFNAQAQRFIYDNIEAIASAYAEKKAKEREFQGQPWTEEQEATLSEMYRSGAKVSDIATTLKRTRGAIRARIRMLGFNGEEETV